MLGQDRCIARPADPEIPIVPPASELVGPVPLVTHRVDVYRRLVEVEPVCDPGWDHERLRGIALELDGCRLSSCAGTRAKVVQPDSRLPACDEKVVRVAPVCVDTP